MTSSMGWLVAAPIAVAALLGAVAAGAQDAPAGVLDAQAGEQLVAASCGTCHDARVIQTAAKDEAGWLATIEDMITRGAPVSDEDKPALVNYLVRFHGPMPDGPGKDIVLNTCSMCHDLTRVKRARHTPEEWEDTLVAMLNEGAPLTDDQFPIVWNYLATHFGLD
jgi:cytochrome c5